MTKKKVKSLKKRAKKAAINDIAAKIVSELTSVTSGLGEISTKLGKTIEKESRKFAKKISGKINLHEVSVEVSKDTPPLVKTETPVEQAGPTETSVSASPKLRQKSTGTKPAAAVGLPTPGIAVPVSKSKQIKKSSALG